MEEETNFTANDKKRILIIGATGKLGFEIAKSSLQASYPTFCLVRPSSLSDTDKSRKIQILSDSGAVILQGSLHDEGSLIEAIKQVNIVICAVNSKQVLDQKPLISAIKKVGSIQRFIPSEFGLDPDRTHISEMDQGFYSRKSEIRRLVEAEAIPYTFISCNFFMSYLLPSLVQPGIKVPPRDKVTIFGDGNVKGVFMSEKDVAAYTISTVDDQRTLNKILYLRPPGNVYSMNELVQLWEQKIGKQLEKIYVSEQDLLKKIEETPYPYNMEMVFIYAAFVKGFQTNFEVEAPGGEEGSVLYPHIKYTTISMFLDTLL
ncbi:probable pinoresinol-lariciresinol reductase 3 [Rutidosis leptorrhynchoides]|uniref:probable pinoresinol-lariciresinol reductase 3 n=1 Tax=Rutidosis leptorrhynchoides TaxID=125765 RepID=UPI003A98E43E